MLDPQVSQLVGRTLGRFRVIRRIGAGGMGVVYEALNAERNLSVALKTLNHLEADSIYRLKNEFRSLAGVVHPNLVKMHELSCVGGQWFFVMDYVEGVPFVDHVRGVAPAPSRASVTTVDLRKRVLESNAPLGSTPAPPPRPGPPPNAAFFEKIRRASAQLIAGVRALHDLGKIHRDLKPSNVLVTAEGKVVILDFGLTTDDQPPPEQSAQKGLVGTPVYMAPEMFTGEWAGPAADWYAVGVMLYEALTGVLPQRGAVRELMALKLFGEPEPPRGVVPATPDDLNDVCLRLLSRDPAARPNGAELQALLPIDACAHPTSKPEARPVPAPFVGRRDELSVLGIALERVVAGRAILVSIAGESGIGKSALCEAFLNRIRGERDTTVLAGRCYEHESVPYKAFDQIADALSHYLNRCGDTEAALVMPRDPAALTILFPVLARVPLIEALAARPLPSDPAELRARGFAAFAELLRRLADRRRLVLVIDDLQWSDADSALLLKDAFAGREPPGCLLITTSRQARPEALRGLLSVMGEGERGGLEVVELQLSGLSAEESTTLAGRVGLGAPEGREAVVAITAEAKGNPFFVVALARNASQAPRAVDASLKSFMRGWVGSLPAPASQLLKIIAVAGRPVDETVVAKAAGSVETASDLSYLAGQHFIGAWPTPSRIVECYHDQIREAVVASLRDEERRDLHARLADVLETAQDADAQQLAVHFLAAGEAHKGSLYAEQTADQARKALAFLDAARWYERALSSAGPEPERVRELQTKLGEAYSGAGRGATAAQWFLDAARTAPFHSALKLRQRAAELLLVSGHIDDGVRVLDEVLGHIRMQLTRSPRRALASLLWQRARLRFRGLDFVETDPATISESDLLKIDACWSVALGLSLVDPVRAANFQTRNVRLSLDSGEPYRVARALAMEAGFRASGGSKTEADAKALSKVALELAHRVGNPHAIGLTTLTAGLGQYLVGHWRAACDLLSRAEKVLSEQPGAIWELNAAQRFWLNSLAFIGDIPAIARRLPELIKKARERGNLYAECNLRVRHCVLWIARDDAQGCIAETTDAMQRWSQEGFHLPHYNELFAHVNCALYLGRVEEAMRRIDSTWSRLEKSLLLRNQAVRIEATHLRTRVCLAYLAHASPDPRVRKTLDGDIRRLHGEEIPWAGALASFAQGLSCAVFGEREASRRWLELAAQELRAGDMHLLEAATEWRLGQLAGGESGRTRIADARAWFTTHQIMNPERFVEHCAPGIQ